VRTGSDDRVGPSSIHPLVVLRLSWRIMSTKYLDADRVPQVHPCPKPFETLSIIRLCLDDIQPARGFESPGTLTGPSPLKLALNPAYNQFVGSHSLIRGSGRNFWEGIRSASKPYFVTRDFSLARSAFDGTTCESLTFPFGRY